MLKISKQSSKTITVTENNVEYPLAARYEANGNGRGLITLTPNRTSKVFAEEFANIEVDGTTYATEKACIVALNDFIGSFCSCSLSTPIPTPTEKVLDLIIVAGQSNSVCYTGTNGASLDVAAGSKVFEFRASTKVLQPLANPVGETPSDAGSLLGYTTGGTFFRSMGKAYTEATQHHLCVLPCGWPSVATNSYYSGGAGYTVVMNRMAAFKQWYASQSDYKLGKVMLVWHQGESGTGDGTRNMKDATKKVFDDLKAAIPELDQCFFCRISQNALETGAATKLKNEQFSLLNAESGYVMVYANAMKYYWLNQYSDDHHYDQYACNDMGKEIGKNIALYYSTSNAKPETLPFDTTKGTHAFSGFSGITITDNKLCYFTDSVNPDKKWALGSSLYDSYAAIKGVVLNEQTTQFDLSFNLKRGDMEGTALSPILGGTGSITINANSVAVSDGSHSVTLTHNVSPFTVRSGLITKPTTNNVYRLVKNGSNFELHVNGMVKDTKPMPASFNATFNQLLKNGVSYLEGVVTDFSLAYKQSVTPPTGFNYIDTVKHTEVVKADTVTGTEVRINSVTDGYKQTLLNAPLSLKTNEVWTLTTEFTPTTWGIGSWFTLLGTAHEDLTSSVWAVQLGETTIRFFMNADWTVTHGLNLALNTRHKLEVISTGNGILNIRINNTPCPDVTLPFGFSQLACHCRCVGQSFFSGGNMQHIGTLHYLHVS